MGFNSAFKGLNQRHNNT